MKSAVRVSVLALAAFAVLEETALARSYLSCLAKKVVLGLQPTRVNLSFTPDRAGNDSVILPPIARVVPLPALCLALSASR